MDIFFSGMNIVGRIFAVCAVIALALIIVGSLVGFVIFMFSKIFSWFTNDGYDNKTPADRWFEARFGNEYWEDTAVKNLCAARSCDRCYHPEDCTCRKCARCDRGERGYVIAGREAEE